MRRPSRSHDSTGAKRPGLPALGCLTVGFAVAYGATKWQASFPEGHAAVYVLGLVIPLAVLFAVLGAWRFVEGRLNDAFYKVDKRRAKRMIAALDALGAFDAPEDWTEAQRKARAAWEERQRIRRVRKGIAWVVGFFLLVLLLVLSAL